MIIKLNNVKKSFGIDEILKDINLEINDGERIGLLGVNGVGKSTLLNVMTGELNSDSGDIFVAKDKTIGYLKQVNALDTTNTIDTEIHSVFSEVYAIGDKLEKMRNENDFSREYDRLNLLFESMDGYKLETKINIVLNGIGFKDYDRNTKIEKLSGGEKNRLAFAKLLLKSPDLLILDEPTNHLDFSALSWLEEYLLKYKGAIFVVSHDRYFLDKVVENICEIDNGELRRYKGGYSSFVRQKEERLEFELKEYEKQQEEIAKMKDFVAKNLAKSSSINSVGSRVKALEKMEKLEKPKPNTEKIKLSFDFDIEPFKNVLNVEKLTVYVGENELKKLICNNINFGVQKGDKIALIGANGIGKSTFIKALLAKIKSEGKIRWGENTKIAYFSQENEELNFNNTVIDELYNNYPMAGEQKIRSTLAALLIKGDDVYKKIKDLSGGERAKVVFALIVLKRANVIVMDEPTNHLDYKSKESLEKALMEYKGTILMISHDRYMLNRVPTKMVEMFNNRFEIYDGGYDYYLSHKRNEVTEKVVQKVEAKDNSGYYRSKAQRAEEQKKKNKIKELEKNMAELEAREKEIIESMSQPEAVSDYVKLTELSNELQEIKNKMDVYMEEWLINNEN